MLCCVEGNQRSPDFSFSCWDLCLSKSALQRWLVYFSCKDSSPLPGHWMPHAVTRSLTLSLDPLTWSVDPSPDPWSLTQSMGLPSGHWIPHPVTRSLTWSLDPPPGHWIPHLVTGCLLDPIFHHGCVTPWRWCTCWHPCLPSSSWRYLHRGGGDLLCSVSCQHPDQHGQPAGAQ